MIKPLREMLRIEEYDGAADVDDNENVDDEFWILDFECTGSEEVLPSDHFCP